MSLQTYNYTIDQTSKFVNVIIMIYDFCFIFLIIIDDNFFLH